MLAAAHVGFPSVIKPVSAAGSLGVIRVNDEGELADAYDRVVGDLTGCRIVAGELVPGSCGAGAGDAGDAGAWIEIAFMLEEVSHSVSHSVSNN